MSGIETVADLAGWLRTSALPVWATLGFDESRGRFHERLDLAGRPLDVPHRSMVQARQIFVYAEACKLGWFPEGGELALRAMAALEREFAIGSGGRTAFRFATHGAGADLHDSYGHAFILLAIASLHRLAPDPRLPILAGEILAFVDFALMDPLHGGMFDTAPRATEDKRQNPVMHLLEACLALEEAMPGQGHLHRAAGLVALFEERLLDQSCGAIIEHFSRDWGDHADPGMTAVVEPGHLFEWVWLLDRFAALSGEGVDHHIACLHRAAALGVTEQALVVDVLAAPDLRVAAATHRLWPHTEAIKAAGVRSRAGDQGAAHGADAFARALGRHFLDRPFAGGWIDRIDPSGLPLSIDVPASSLYHLALAAMDAGTVSGAAPR